MYEWPAATSIGAHASSIRVSVPFVTVRITNPSGQRSVVRGRLSDPARQRPRLGCPAPISFVHPPRPGMPGTIPPTTCGEDMPVPSGMIATIAGTGAGGYSGDGGPAIAASLDVGQGIAVDQAGNVYFSDPAARAVRRISIDGVLTTIVGPATGGPLEQPQGLAFGSDGALYVADYGAGRIWRVDEGGAITPVAGEGGKGRAATASRRSRPGSCRSASPSDPTTSCTSMTPEPIGPLIAAASSACSQAGRGQDSDDASRGSQSIGRATSSSATLTIDVCTR